MYTISLASVFSAVEEFGADTSSLDYTLGYDPCSLDEQESWLDRPEWSDDPYAYADC